MVLASIDRKIVKYATNIEKIEEHVKRWEEEFKLKAISASMQKLLDAFSDIQLSITKVSDPALKKEYELNCYNATYDFLSFVDNDVNSDFYIYITNKVAEFSKVIKCFSQYCTNIERKYDIELYSEKLFGVSPRSSKKKLPAKRK